MSVSDRARASGWLYVCMYGYIYMVNSFKLFIPEGKRCVLVCCSLHKGMWSNTLLCCICSCDPLDVGSLGCEYSICS